MSLLEEYKETIDALSEYHNQVESRYAGLANGGSYSDYFNGTLSTPRDIIEYIHREGGGVTEAELRSVSRARFDEMLNLLMEGMSPTTLEMKVKDYRGVIDPYYASLALTLFAKHSILPSRILKPAVHKEPDGTFFLTCQKKGDAYVVDPLAQYGDIKAMIRSAEAIIAKSETLAKQKKLRSAKESSLEEVKAERKSLGLFKGQRGKELKVEINKIEDEISKIDESIARTEKAQSTLRSIENVFIALSS